MHMHINNHIRVLKDCFYLKMFSMDQRSHRAALMAPRAPAPAKTAAFSRAPDVSPKSARAPDCDTGQAPW